MSYVVFFFNDTATTEIYTLSLHDALPISGDPAGVEAVGDRIGPERRGEQPHGGDALAADERDHPPADGSHDGDDGPDGDGDRKSTRLNSSHANISYAVFCLKKQKYNSHRP